MISTKYTLSIIMVLLISLPMTLAADFDSLAQQFENDNPILRQSAALQLTNLDDRRSVALFIEGLEDPDTSVRRLCAIGLGVYGSKAADYPLARAIQNPHSGIQDEAAEALGRIGSRRVSGMLVQSVVSDNPTIRRTSIKALGLMRDIDSIPQLIPCLGDANIFVQQETAQALARMGRPSIPPLTQVIQDAPPDTALYAVKALGLLGSSEALSVLIDALQHPELAIARAAAQALGSLGEPAAALPLRNVMNRCDGPHMNIQEVLFKASVVEAIGRIYEPKSVSPLIYELKSDSNPLMVRQYLAIALGRLINDRAVGEVAQLLLEDDVFIVNAAKEALSRIINIDAAPYLIQYVERNENPDLEFVQKSFLKIGKPALPYLLEMKNHQNLALQNMGAQIWEALELTEEDISLLEENSQL